MTDKANLLSSKLDADSLSKVAQIKTSFSIQEEVDVFIQETQVQVINKFAMAVYDLLKINLRADLYCAELA